jgi:uncharacterized iron-regulated membrane protein
MNSLYEALTMFGLFGAVVIVIFILAKYTYLTRKALAEHGAGSGRASNRIRYLELGCIVLGLGVGLGFSAVFTVLDLSEDTMDLLVYGTIMIGGGLGLVGAHYIREREE